MVDSRWAASVFLVLCACASTSKPPQPDPSPTPEVTPSPEPEAVGPRLALSCYSPDIPDDGGAALHFAGGEGSPVESLVQGVGSESSGEDIVRPATGTPGSEWPLGTYTTGDWTLVVTAKVEPPSEYNEYTATWTTSSESAMDMVCYRFTRS